MTDQKPDRKLSVGSVFDLPAKSYNLVKENWQMFALVNVLALFAALFETFDRLDKTGTKASDGLNPFSSGASFFDWGFVAGLGIIFVLIAILVSIFLYAMSTSLEVRVARGEKPEANTLFNDAKKYWLRLFGLVIVIGVIVIVGLILLIVPGIIAIIRLCMAPYLMVDKDLSIEESLSASNEMGKKNMGPVAAAIGVTILIGIGVGLFGVIPVVGQVLATIAGIFFSLILVLRYQELRGAKKPETTHLASPIASE